MRDDRAKFEAAGALVFGVNGNTAEAHRAYCDKFQFGFPLLSDEGLEVSKAYKAEKGGGIKRTVVVIAPDGNVKYHKAGMPTDDEILAALK